LKKKIDFFPLEDIVIDGQEDILSADITAIINIFDYPFSIKKNVILSSEESIEGSLGNIIDNLIEEYKPYAKLPSIDVKTQVYDLVMPSGKGGILIHEAIGHALEADNFFSDKGILFSKWKKRIADKSISISDSPTHIEGLNFEYSADGSKTYDIQLVKDGIVEGLLSDRQTSRLYDICNTGNGRSSSYEHQVIPRMRNTYLHNGSHSHEEIISDTKKGIYILDIGGGQVDIKTGNFVFNVQSGCLIENGNLVSLTRPFLFKGNTLDIFDKIDMLGNNLKFQLANCSKHGQLLPVTYGQPTLRISGHNI